MRPRVFPGGPHTSTPITAAAISEMDAHLNTTVDWVSEYGENIGGTKTFNSSASCDVMSDSLIRCSSTLTETTSGDEFTQTGATIGVVRSNEWNRRTALVPQELVFPATDCSVSVLGPVSNTSTIEFDGRHLGWQMTMLGTYASSLNVERNIGLPQTIPLGATIDEVELFFTGQLTTTFPAGSRPIQGHYNKALNGRPKYGGDVRVMCEPMDSLGDCSIVFKPGGQLQASDRIIVGLKQLVSTTWTFLFYKVRVKLSNVTRHAFDRGWV